MSCGIAIENKEVWLAAERESINPAAANGERVCRVALLKNKGTPRYARFWGDSFDEAQDKALSWRCSAVDRLFRWQVRASKR